MSRDLAKEQVVSAVKAWSYWIGCGEPLHEALPISLEWLSARWDAGDEHLPLGLVHDLGFLLLRGREFPFASARSLAHWPAEERARRLEYEDRVLGRWALDPSITELHIAIAGMPEHFRHRAVEHSLGLALGNPLRNLEELLAGNPAHLRNRTPEFLSAIPERFEGWAEAIDEGWREWGRNCLDACLAVLPHGRMFRAEDLWEVIHLPELPNDSDRLALRLINGAAGRVGPVPPSVALSVRRRAREVPIDADESDHYPAGGFDAVSTRGVFENLVRTEIAYVGEGRTDPGDVPGARSVDLFDIRFAENELLYYTRDESPLLDARRDVAIVFDRPSEQRFKQPELPAQTLVLSEGMGLAFQNDLLRVFGPLGARARLYWRAPEAADREVAQEELRLLEFTLASEIAHRRIEIGIIERWDELPEIPRIIFSPRAAETNITIAAWVRVGGDKWIIDGVEYDLREGALVLRSVADALLVAASKPMIRPKLKKKKPATGTPATTTPPARVTK